MKRKFSVTWLVIALFLLVAPTMVLAAGVQWKKLAPSNESYIVAFTKKSSGIVYGYENGRETSKWIDCKEDECWIMEISKDGTLVYVSYPKTNGNGKRIEGWFKASDFACDCPNKQDADGKNVSDTTLKGKFQFFVLWKRVNIYKRPNTKESWGYAISDNNNDKVYLIGMSADGKYVQLAYKTSSGYWKMGYAVLEEFLFAASNRFDSCWYWNRK